MTVYRLPPAIESYLATLPTHSQPNADSDTQISVQDSQATDNNQGERMNGNEKNSGIFGEFLGYVDGFVNDPIDALEREFGPRDNSDPESDESKRVSFTARKRSTEPTKPATAPKRESASGPIDIGTEKAKGTPTGNEEQKESGTSEA